MSRNQLDAATCKRILRDPRYLLAFGLGSGLSPWAPGTMGTLFALPLFWWLSGLSLLLYIAVVVLLFVVGVWLCQVTASGLAVHDHPGIVWDEVVGYLVTMIALPANGYWMLAGFVLFRFFDILKPWPIHVILTKSKSAIGIMFDDVLAGLFAAVLLQLARVGFDGCC